MGHLHVYFLGNGNSKLKCLFNPSMFYNQSVKMSNSGLWADDSWSNCIGRSFFPFHRFPRIGTPQDNTRKLCVLDYSIIIANRTNDRLTIWTNKKKKFECHCHPPKTKLSHWANLNLVVGFPLSCSFISVNSYEFYWIHSRKKRGTFPWLLLLMPIFKF